MFNLLVFKLNILYLSGKEKLLLLLKQKIMFGMFKKKTEKEKLQEKYQKLQKECFDLSTTNRKLSDQKAYEAEEVMKQLEKLKDTK